MSGSAPLRAALALAVLGAACEPSRQPPQPQVYPRWWQSLPTPSPTATPTPLPPTPPTPRCNVAILDREPAEPTDIVGIVEVSPRRAEADPESALEAARLQACALGGDAIVITYRREKRRSGQVAGPAPQGVLPDPEVRGVVIRYRER